MVIIKQKQLPLPISIVKAITYKRGSCMITIGKIPRKLQSFFKPVKKQISEHVHNYFWSIVLSVCISHGCTIERLVKSLRSTTHRTNYGEFLWRSNWDQTAITQKMALDMLRSLFTKKDKNIFLIIDETQTLKRAKKMEAVGKLRHHATGKYGRNVLKNSGKWCSIVGLRKTGEYRLAERIRRLKKLGTVKVVFSRRRGESKHIAIVTDNLRTSMKTIVGDYLKRWSIEMLIKDEKQHLGLGDYRVKRYRAVVRYLHLVDCAYTCLTYVGIKTYRAQGQNNSKKVLRLEPISKLKDRMRRIVWQENVQDAIKYSHEKPCYSPPGKTPRGFKSVSLSN